MERIKIKDTLSGKEYDLTGSLVAESILTMPFTHEHTMLFKTDDNKHYLFTIGSQRVVVSDFGFFDELNIEELLYCDLFVANDTKGEYYKEACKTGETYEQYICRQHIELLANYLLLKAISEEIDIDMDYFDSFNLQDEFARSYQWLRRDGFVFMDEIQEKIESALPQACAA